MFEVELKVPADLERVRRRLTRVVGEPRSVRRQRDVYYDAPDRDFAETDEALRLRSETRIQDGSRSDFEATESLVTYKGPLVDDGSKTREEYETRVCDAESVHSILSGLGYSAAATVSKTREIWAVGGTTVALDSVDGVGEYVEVECQAADESAIVDTRERVKGVLEELGLDADDSIQTSYLGLLLADSDQ